MIAKKLQSKKFMIKIISKKIGKTQAKEAYASFHYYVFHQHVSSECNIRSEKIREIKQHNVCQKKPFFTKIRKKDLNSGLTNNIEKTLVMPYYSCR